MNEPISIRTAVPVHANGEVEHPEALLDLARHGRLGDTEWQELRAHLETCPPCAFQYHAAGHALGDSGATRASDAQLERRAVQSVLRTLERAPRMTSAPAFRRRWTALGVGVLLLSGTALAATWWSVQRAARPLSASRTPMSRLPSASEPPADWRSSEPSPTLASGRSQEERQEKLQNGATDQVGAVRGHAHEPDARDLFVRARGLRLHGRTREALTTYQRLQNAFPGSRESHLSHLVAGQIWLDRGRPELAFEQFGRYLEAGDDGASEEALVGRATALGGMGRLTEEAAEWRRLLGQHPRSVYAARAAERLAALADSSAAHASPSAHRP